MSKLYVDFMSQPSRACVIFCRLHALPVEERVVSIHKGDLRQTWYREKCALGKVPLLEDGDLTLPESGAILSYLAVKYNVAGHWYPLHNPAVKAGVDAALLWIQGNVRAGEMRLAWHRAIAPANGLPCDPAIAAEGEAICRTSVRDLDQYWLQRSRFMCGERATIADLLCCCELEQLLALEGVGAQPTLAQLLQGVPRVREWMEEVAALCEPHYTDAHKHLRAVVRHWAKKGVGRAKL